MKLTDLDPRWWTEPLAAPEAASTPDTPDTPNTPDTPSTSESDASIADTWPDALGPGDPKPKHDRRVGLGLSFLCPICRFERVYVAFENPICSGPATKHAIKFWRREGSQFETISLFPSINMIGNCSENCPGWHGQIQFGGVF